jgi:hypothetical protein
VGIKWEKRKINNGFQSGKIIFHAVILSKKIQWVGSGKIKDSQYLGNMSYNTNFLYSKRDRL